MTDKDTTDIPPDLWRKIERMRQRNEELVLEKVELKKRIELWKAGAKSAQSGETCALELLKATTSKLEAIMSEINLLKEYHRACMVSNRSGQPGAYDISYQAYVELTERLDEKLKGV